METTRQALQSLPKVGEKYDALHISDPEFLRFTKALSSKTRLRIIEFLKEERLDISRLAEKLDQTEANVSAQIKILLKAKIVESEFRPGAHGIRKICSLTNNKYLLQF